MPRWGARHPHADPDTRLQVGRPVDQVPLEPVPRCSGVTGAQVRPGANQAAATTRPALSAHAQSIASVTAAHTSYAADRADARRSCGASGHDRLMRRLVMTAAQMVVGGAVLALTGCAAASRDSASPPPPGAPPSVVLETYLRALVAGDCASAHAAATSTFATDPAELCGEVRVSAFSIRGDPATPDPNEVVYMTILTTSGSSDGTIARGETDWFYGLEREGGEWRLVSGGSGP